MKPPLPSISFETLAKFGALKRKLRKASGSDEAYYNVLNWEGFDKSSHIATEATAHYVLGQLNLQYDNWRAWWADRGKKVA